MKFEKIGSDGRPIGAPTLAAFLDPKTNLMWAAEDLPGTHSWESAKKACADFRGAGFDDWRLPTLDELETLRDLTRHDPAADPELKIKSEYYWSSTPAAWSPGSVAWLVNIRNGDAYYSTQSNEAFVRAVRSSRASQ